ncbi:MAG: hypothetical protein UX88_C0001G0034 [Candidatus Woesebacteria bacterium GW2011_GWC2_47_16]|nr:MAG: hypothetical protein UX03_C0003G0017 [Candidatus Woesebacteria bacterium GW2011_GWE1_45_18]KKU25153.1 MAG: hypothetical protein UX34_C0002G0016 [Candidatus Woesebacteria bacterium GW2011_GWF1_46_13]KKU49325.1 MAG: hypothetical protein UX67_C0002G0010 [Candidatus Woesebacteria bacterium GW2011_GWF2_46_8]KKU65374.1 MAG: hypothetical protein UX88_C0001G0034 [Candidatus Woesebacteria bacterium GW2011_GWC2_47_16]KKU71199.1 MAG: hypothetical protein UX95_C0002G0020 [Candidatus Woesebacteria b
MPQKSVFNIFLLGVFLVLLPPVRLPFLDLSFWNTNLLGRGLIDLAFLYVLLKSFFDRKEVFVVKKNNVFYVFAVLGVFVLHSLSVFSAINILTFLKAFEKLIFGFMGFLSITYFVGKNKKVVFEKIILVFFLAGIFKLLLEAMLIAYPEFSTTFADIVLKEEVARSIRANLARGRTYIDLLLEISLPFFLYYFLKKGTRNYLKLAGLVLGVLLGFVSFLSTWRGRFVIYITMVVFSFAYLKSLNFKKAAFLFATGLFLLLSFYLLDKRQILNQGFSVVDRLLNKDVVEDQMTISWRIEAIKESFVMGSVSLFGVGIGNYYEWTAFKPITQYLPQNQKLITEAAATSGPHNIFAQFLAETGYFSFVVFILVLLVFLVNDLKIFLSKDVLWLEKMTIVLAFWGLIAGTLFYPATSLSFFISFFVFRGLLYN